MQQHVIPRWIEILQNETTILCGHTRRNPNYVHLPLQVKIDIFCFSPIFEFGIT